MFVSSRTDRTSDIPDSSVFFRTKSRCPLFGAKPPELIADTENPHDPAYGNRITPATERTRARSSRRKRREAMERHTELARTGSWRRDVETPVPLTWADPPS